MSPRLQDAIFAVFDVDQTGKVSFANMKAIFLDAELPGLDDTPECNDAIQGVIDEFDADGDGELNVEEFRMALNGYLGDAVFMFLHQGKHMNVTFQDLKDAQTECPEQFLPDASDEDIQNVIAEYDKDGDGELNAVEFAAACAGGD